jgi:hypothetical protein
MLLMDIQGHADPRIASQLGYSVITYLSSSLSLLAVEITTEMRSVLSDGMLNCKCPFDYCYTITKESFSISRNYSLLFLDDLD